MADIYSGDDLALSQSLLSRGKSRKALEAAIRADLQKPGNSDVLQALAEAQLACGKLGPADETASRLIELFPLSPAGYDLRGRVALRHHGFVEAEGFFRYALQLQPRVWTTMNNLGIALRGQKRHKEAIDVLEAAWRANPKAFETKRNLFGATRAYVGAGGVAAIVFWLHFFPLLAHVARLPAAIQNVVVVVGLVLTLGGLWWLGTRRRRQLSPEVVRLYRSELGRARWLELLRGLFKAGPNVLIVLALVALILADVPGIFIWILFGMVAVVAWMVLAPRLWSRFILPRFQNR